jgi:hypothetical protein
MNDPTLKEGYHPTLCENLRTFVGEFWKLNKIKGIFKGVNYVKKSNNQPKAGTKYLIGSVYTLDGQQWQLGNFIRKGRLLLLNFGSQT